MELTADGGFSPKTLSRTKQTPIAIKASGKVRMQDGSHPPAIREIIIETDKNGEAHTKGIPVCRSGRLQATDTAAALKACRRSLIGEGTAVAQVAFAEQRPRRLRHLLHPRNLQVGEGRRGGLQPDQRQCSDGKLKVHALGKFEDGTQAETEIIRACNAR